MSFWPPSIRPLRTDEENVSIDRLAMGGINVYLDESLPLWRWMPALVRRLFDRPCAGLLGRPARQQHAPGTAWAADGGHVPRRRRAAEKRDPSSLSIGCKPRSGPTSCTCPTSCSPDWPVRSASAWACRSSPRCRAKTASWKSFPRPYHAQARAELRARAADLAGLVALCGYYADFMAEYLAVPREKIDVIRPGLNLDGIRRDRRQGGKGAG